MKKQQKVDRNPVVMFTAGLMLLMSLALVVLGIIYFKNLGLWVAGAMILGGLASSGLALMTIVRVNQSGYCSI